MRHTFSIVTREWHLKIVSVLFDIHRNEITWDVDTIGKILFCHRFNSFALYIWQRNKSQCSETYSLTFVTSSPRNRLLFCARSVSHFFLYIHAYIMHACVYVYSISFSQHLPRAAVHCALFHRCNICCAHSMCLYYYYLLRINLLIIARRSLAAYCGDFASRAFVNFVIRLRGVEIIIADAK